MKLIELVNYAKLAQGKLKNFSLQADHIYVVDINTSAPALVFISEKYNSFDLYSRTNISTKIHTGPLNIRYFVLGYTHFNNQNSGVTRSELYRATKIYGKSPLLFDNFEYASISDTNFISGRDVDARIGKTI